MEKWRAIYDALTVGRSRFAGRGLFAGTRIPARAKIGDYEGEVIGLREARRRARGRRIVAIVELEGFAIDAAGMARGFRYINHSCDPNTFIRCTSARGVLRASRHPCGRGAHLRLRREPAQRHVAVPLRRPQLPRVPLVRGGGIL